MEDSMGSSSSAEDLLLLLRRVRRNDPSVHRVDLDRKRLPNAYLKAIIEALESNQHVKGIRLSRVGVTDVLTPALAKLLLRNRRLVDVDLSRNDISDVGLKLIVASLKNKDFGDCSLRRFVLEGNNIKSGGIQELCKAVPELGVQTLKVGKHDIGKDGVEAIVQLIGLPQCPLHKLDLRCCKIHDAGTCLIAEALQKNTSLRSLCLGRNFIQDTAVSKIALALKDNTTLHCLDLQYNSFTDEGVVAIAQSLQTSSHSFQKLKVRHCDFVSAGMKAELFELLSVNAHGPVLAQKTKEAMKSLISEGLNGESGQCSYESEDNDFSESTAASQDYSVVEVPPSTSKELAGHEYQDNNCVICFDLRADCALLPCKHRNVCDECASRLKKCHMCRETVVTVFPLSGRRIGWRMMNSLGNY